ncbi:MAG: four-carbon acid sugar kinase family protein [Terracidiphilus sp.]
MLAEFPSLDLVPHSFSDSPSGRIVLLADDLTGACDAGVAFLHSGRTVRVWFGASALHAASESVQAFTTNSRSLSASCAASAVSHAAKALASNPDSLFFKKVDSACRGPVGAEVLAAQDAISSRAVIFTPSFPSAGRTVRDGTLQIHDSAGQHKEIRLANLFPLADRNQVGLVSDPSQIESALNSGKTILICDSETQADLESLVRAVRNLPGLLYAGSAGLAMALAGLIASRPPGGAHVPPVERRLLIAGSTHPVTRLQLQTLDRGRFKGLRVMRLGLPLALRARIRSAFRSYQPQALILTGGETALLAVHALGADSFILQGEIGSGIPWGLIQGGLAHGCVVVTKSGGFGTPSAFNDILSAFQVAA